jgi:transcriptional regulator
VAIELTIETIEGNFKLNQHKSDADHVAIAGALSAQSDASAQAIAQRMVAMRPHLDYQPALSAPAGTIVTSAHDLAVAAK